MKKRRKKSGITYLLSIERSVYTALAVKYVMSIEWSVNKASAVISAVNCQLPTVL